MRSRATGLITLLGLALIPTPTLAAEPGALAQPPAGIVGGEPSGPCEWPSVVALQTGGLCTATLVHPRVIVYAAHCGTLHTRALFGETVRSPARELPILRCERNSELFAVSSEDYAYCELAEPVEDVAITPLLFGCDEALIEIGTPVTIVGFGDTTTAEPEQVGSKHAAAAAVVGYLSTVGIGGMGVGADAGDSGGPALVQLDDGSWRVLGIVSGGGGDGATVQYVPAPKTVAWIEERSNIDITPCHDGDGSWAPTPACEGMFVSVDPGASWAAGCPGPSSPPSQRCGPAWTELEPDDEPPSVTILEPLDGTMFDGEQIELEVIGEADDLPHGSAGVARVRLLVDGAPWLDELGREAVDEVPPYRFEGVRLEAAGPHAITLVAIDHFGNVGEATATIVLVSPSDDETDETDVGTDGTDTGEESGETDPAGDPPSSTCACTSRRPQADESLAFVLMAALGLGSRRRSRAAIQRRR
ncbi:MAG TPA: trypsin-like serine protease [Enhygromyxa sp.]|nr:trypsin-like serine protease [Enhygromyxa sp.]